MNRYSIGAEAFDALRCHNDIRRIATTGIADGGNFINVYA
jgi:hypothetical protein